MVLKDRISRIHRLEETLGYAFKTLRKLYIPKIRTIVLPVGLTKETNRAIDFSSRLSMRFRSKIKLVAFRKLSGNKAEEIVSECVRKLRKNGIKRVEKVVVEDFAPEEIANLVSGIPLEYEVVTSKIKSFDLIVFPIPLTSGVKPYSSLEEKAFVYVSIINSLVRKHANPVLLVKNTNLNVEKIFGSIMVSIYNIDEIYSLIPIALAVADPGAKIMLNYLMDKDSLESTKETIHELSEEAVDVEWEIEELVTDKCDRKIEEIEPKIAEMNFKPFHSVTCGETISTLQTLADQNDMGLIVLAGYGAVKLMEPEIAKLALESNRPILIIPSRSMREDSDMTNEETLQKRMDLTEPTGKKKLTKQKRSQGK